MPATSASTVDPPSSSLKNKNLWRRLSGGKEYRERERDRDRDTGEASTSATTSTSESSFTVLHAPGSPRVASSCSDTHAHTDLDGDHTSCTEGTLSLSSFEVVEPPSPSHTRTDHVHDKDQAKMKRTVSTRKVIRRLSMMARKTTAAASLSSPSLPSPRSEPSTFSSPSNRTRHALTTPPGSSNDHPRYHHQEEDRSHLDHEQHERSENHPHPSHHHRHHRTSSWTDAAASLLFGSMHDPIPHSHSPSLAHSRSRVLRTSRSLTRTADENEADIGPALIRSRSKLRRKRNSGGAGGGIQPSRSLEPFQELGLGASTLASGSSSSTSSSSSSSSRLKSKDDDSRDAELQSKELATTKTTGITDGAPGQLMEGLLVSSPREEISDPLHPNPKLTVKIVEKRYKFTLGNESEGDLSHGEGLGRGRPGFARRETGISSDSFVGRRRWTLASALTDERISDEGLVRELDRMREVGRGRGKSRTHLQTHQDENDEGEFEEDWGIWERTTSPRLDLTSRQHSSSSTSSSVSLMWHHAQRALLACRELILTERRYLLAMLDLIEEKTVRPPPPLMKKRAGEIANISNVLLSGFQIDPSATGVARVFSEQKEEMEKAYGRWSECVGTWFEGEQYDSDRDREKGELRRSSSTWRKSMPVISGLGSSDHSTTITTTTATGTKRKTYVRDLAILPTQRVMRYVLLFRDLVAHTPPTCPSRNVVEEAAEVATRLAATCDKAQRHKAFAFGSSSSPVPPSSSFSAIRHATACFSTSTPSSPPMRSLSASGVTTTMVSMTAMASRPKIDTRKSSSEESAECRSDEVVDSSSSSGTSSTVSSLSDDHHHLVTPPGTSGLGEGNGAGLSTCPSAAMQTLGLRGASEEELLLGKSRATTSLAGFVNAAAMGFGVARAKRRSFSFVVGGREKEKKGS